MKMLSWVQNEQFTFEIKSEKAVVGCTLEHWRVNAFSVPTQKQLKVLKTIKNQVAAIRHQADDQSNIEKSPTQ